MKRTPIELAKLVLANGHPFKENWFCDGTSESGPYGGTMKGYKWGQLRLTLSSNNSVYLEKKTDFGCTWWWVYDTSLGGQRHWDDPERVAVQTTLQAIA